MVVNADGLSVFVILDDRELAHLLIRELTLLTFVIESSFLFTFRTTILAIGLTIYLHTRVVGVLMLIKQLYLVHTLSGLLYWEVYLAFDRFRTAFLVKQ